MLMLHVYMLIDAHADANADAHADAHHANVQC
jgi:hypothetical protein